MWWLNGDEVVNWRWGGYLEMRWLIGDGVVNWRCGG